MTSEPYDDQNIFARILRDELPSETVYEDEHTIAVMDVMPQSPGHVLVIPKSPSRNLLDADPSILGPLLTTTQTLGRAVQAAFDADGVTIMQFNEAAAGQSVFHLHMHVIPRHEGVPLKRHEGTFADPAELKANADKIRAALA